MEEVDLGKDRCLKCLSLSNMVKISVTQIEELRNEIQFLKQCLSQNADLKFKGNEEKSKGKELSEEDPLFQAMESISSLQEVWLQNDVKEIAFEISSSKTYSELKHKLNPNYPVKFRQKLAEPFRNLIISVGVDSVETKDLNDFMTFAGHIEARLKSSMPTKLIKRLEECKFPMDNLIYFIYPICGGTVINYSLGESIGESFQ